VHPDRNFEARSYECHTSLLRRPKSEHIRGLTGRDSKARAVLLPRPGPSHRQKIQVLYGLDGIGKTQLVVEFARRHHRRFRLCFGYMDGAKGHRGYCDNRSDTLQSPGYSA
jgi:hypothetical protein